MRKQGRVLSWNEQKGYGFVQPDDGGKQVFVHISALGRDKRSPRINDVISFVMSTDRQGRPCAARVARPGARSGASRGRRSAILVSLVFLVIVCGAVYEGKLPLFIFVAYLAMSVVAMIFYAADKAAARRGAWRTSESTLHWLALAGGWPGALVAQQTLRHKSQKQSFRSVFWFTVVLNCSGLCWLLTPTGADVIQAWIGDSYWPLESRPVGTIEWAR